MERRELLHWTLGAAAICVGVKSLPSGKGDISLDPHDKELNPGSVSFRIKDSEVMRFDHDGNIYVRGTLVENDQEVVDGIRIWLKQANKTTQS